VNNKQNQQAGDNSTNVQAVQVVINQAPSYDDIKAIALDVFEQNFYQLGASARKIAAGRAAEVTDDFLTKLHEEHPAGFQHAEDPDFQYALFTVQKEYARCGDEELGKLLVDLLVDRAKQASRTVLQIVLNESLSVAPKLTSDQLAALSVIFVSRYTINSRVGDLATLGDYLDEYIKPFASLVAADNSCFQHLEYTGCGTAGVGSHPLGSFLIKTYGGVFSTGFTAKELGGTLSIDHPLIIPCLNDDRRFQVRARNEGELRERCVQNHVPSEATRRLVQLHVVHIPNDDEIEARVIKLRPYMKHLFEVWRESAMQRFNLTSVGIAIGHANVKKSTGSFTDLSIWIK
jgi:hypothetical protein